MQLGRCRSHGMAEQKKGTRVRKSDGQQLEVVTFRMPAKIKHGLELLARLQGRSLTQAIEWALQYTLANVRGHATEPDTIWAVLSIAWKYEGWERVYVLHACNPALVSFEDRHACELVANSIEGQFFDKRLGREGDNAALHLKWVSIIAWAWPKLCGDAAEMTLSELQRPDSRLPLCLDLGLACSQSYGKVWDVEVVVENAYNDLVRQNLVETVASNLEGVRAGLRAAGDELAKLRKPASPPR